MKNECVLTSVNEVNTLPKYISTETIDEKTYFVVYINFRSKRVKCRIQKRFGKIESLNEAIKVRNKWIVEVTKQIAEIESYGFTWGEIVGKWELYWRKYPTRTFNEATLLDHIARAHNWTAKWLDRPACKITIGDARDIIKDAYEQGASVDLRRSIKQTINQIFKWGLEESLIPILKASPAQNIEVLCAGESRPEEKRKEILTQVEIRRLISEAKEKQHPWFPIWFVDFHTGLRSSELEALRKERIDLVPLSVAKSLDQLPDGDERKNYGFIHVDWAWKVRFKRYGPTKAHRCRTVPINSELYYFLIEYLPNANFGKDEIGERVFEKCTIWQRGEQAKILRLFCETNGLKSIKFHTIRACFATQLLSLGVPENKVMKVGGWQDVETMRIYVRLAGIIEHGTTEGLRFTGSNRKFDPSSPYLNADYRKASGVLDLEDEDDGDTKDGVSEALPSNVISFASFRGR